VVIASGILRPGEGAVIAAPSLLVYTTGIELYSSRTGERPATSQVIILWPP